MIYATLDINNNPTVFVENPRTWGNSSFGLNATADDYRAVGLWPVEISDPGPSSEWEVKTGQSHTVDTENKIITRTIEYGLMNLSNRKSIMTKQVEEEYQKSLQRGFTYDGGTFPATGPKRTRVVELVVQQNAGKGMPKGKTTKQFRDLSNTTHDFTASQIADLAEAGSDLVESADDNYESLIEQITMAASHTDLDAIDVTSGWSN